MKAHPSMAAVIVDILVIAEFAIGWSLVLHQLPKAFHGVQLGAFWQGASLLGRTKLRGSEALKSGQPFPCMEAPLNAKCRPTQQDEKIVGSRGRVIKFLAP
jgi:hypothetical protein